MRAPQLLAPLSHRGHLLAGAVAAAALSVAQAAKPPCPEDANLWTCLDWCKVAHPGSSGSMAGEPCSHLTPETAAMGQGPSCMCYDSTHEKVLAACKSSCPAEDDDGLGEEEPVAERADSRRYLLYDVKRGEGFNLQREVFPRSGFVVSELNRMVRDACGGQHSKGRCAEWALVLPPWCRLAHWEGIGNAHVPWREFFDADALKSAEVPVLEFDEYIREVGGPFVDYAVSFTENRIPKAQRYGRKKGGFYGWAKEPEAFCTEGRFSHKPGTGDGGRWRIEYSGECEGDVHSLEYRCAAISYSSVADVATMVAATGPNVTSVLLKNADSMMSPNEQELDKRGLREAMLFAEPIRSAAEEFIAISLGGQPYLAAHCRRTDFLYAREKTTPKPKAIAKQINSALEEYGLEVVFVATDAPSDLREALREAVSGRVVFFEEAPHLAERLGHPGKQAAAEMWVAARATAFLGTQESRFTMHIQLERSWLGHPRATSEREFCKRGKAGQRCVSPGYRHPGRRGSQHALRVEL